MDADMDAEVDVETEVDADADADADADMEAESEQESTIDAAIEAGIDLEANFGTDVADVLYAGSEAAVEEEISALLETNSDSDAAPTTNSTLTAVIKNAGAAVAKAAADAKSTAAADAAATTTRQSGAKKSFCPDGYHLEITPRSTTVQNGCGSDAMKTVSKALVKFLPAAMTQCCNTHDKAYDICGQTRVESDRALKMCLSAAARNTKNLLLKTVPTAFYAAVRLAGGIAYKAAQKNRCQCVLSKDQILASSGKPVISAINVK